MALIIQIVQYFRTSRKTFKDPQLKFQESTKRMLKVTFRDLIVGKSCKVLTKARRLFPRLLSTLLTSLRSGTLPFDMRRRRRRPESHAKNAQSFGGFCKNIGLREFLVIGYCYHIVIIWRNLTKLTRKTMIGI